VLVPDTVFLRSFLVSHIGGEVVLSFVVQERIYRLNRFSRQVPNKTPKNTRMPERVASKKIVYEPTNFIEEILLRPCSSCRPNTNSFGVFSHNGIGFKELEKAEHWAQLV
jgi:hypothetical protein